MNDVHAQNQTLDKTPHHFHVEDVFDVEDAPTLENGDHLTRAEFERRYEAMPDLKKAELIKGVVYMPSPVRHKRHSEPNTDIVTWLGVYRAATPGVGAGVNGSVRLDDENVPQPDAMLRLPMKLGGQSDIDEEDYISGAPELIVEIAASSVSYDLYDKKDVYGQFGAREYIVWRTVDRAIDWFRLENNQYIKIEPDKEGIIESLVFPGLRLATTAMLAGDMARVLAELQRGLESKEHKAFVQRLADIAESKS
ncbi:MAG TPA: Uma2 family endonuclease [Blastocatellia bacterium]|nr:Uma2 family endonuclease [Blastocatellia bacterium]